MKLLRLLFSVVLSILLVCAVCTIDARADNKRTPSDDTFADGQAGQQSTTHDNSQLGVGSVSFPTAAQISNAFLKFDVSYTGTLSKATLWLYANAVTGSAHSVSVYAVSDDSWTEGSLTWNNQPSLGSKLATSAAATGWMSFVVTSYVSAEHSSDGVASFGVAIEPPYGFYVDVFEDREDSGSSGNRPYLLLEGVTAVNISSFTAEPDAGSIRLAWTTASDLDNVGFNLYRAQDPGGLDDGTAVQLNDALIPASGDPILGGSYSFSDLDAEPGVRYYYWLEAVDAAGGKVLHGPVSAALEGHTLFLPFVASQWACCPE